MATERMDARGLSCPQPVVLVNRAIEAGNRELEILVDNEVSKENVLRMVTRKGLKADVRQEGSDKIITTTGA